MKDVSQAEDPDVRGVHLAQDQEGGQENRRQTGQEGGQEPHDHEGVDEPQEQGGVVAGIQEDVHREVRQ